MVLNDTVTYEKVVLNRRLPAEISRVLAKGGLAKTNARMQWKYVWVRLLVILLY